MKIVNATSGARAGELAARRGTVPHGRPATLGASGASCGRAAPLPGHRSWATQTVSGRVHARAEHHERVSGYAAHSTGVHLTVSSHCLVARAGNMDTLWFIPFASASFDGSGPHLLP